MLSLFKFKGGVKPPTNKTQSVQLPIAQAPLPRYLIVPLHQSIGGTPRPVVSVGQQVLKGQLIGEADGFISAAVHAPTSGTVVEIGMATQPHPSGLDAPCVVITPDGRDAWTELTPIDHSSAPPERIRELLQAAGVVGLGGAAFPTHGKLAVGGTPVVELIINGAECEPYITCDDLLMRERAEEVVRGIGIFRDLLQPQKVLIGIEDNKPEAAAAMRAAISALGESFVVATVPTLYPAGGAKQLIRVLTGKEVPAAIRSTEIGVQCFNVATAYSAWRALAYGEPVVSRIVTVTGNVGAPRNYEVRIGTPMRDVLALAEPKPDTDGAIMGGPMMGFVVPTLDVPIIKATNCLIARSPALFPPPPPEMPCIRCGECAKACPHELQPFEMYWYSRAKNFGKTQEYAIFDCIECGCCSYVCPSHIPLVQYFRFAKSEIWARERDKNAADGAKDRFEFKQFRDDREKAEKTEKLAKAAAAQAAKLAAEAAAKAAESSAPTADTAPAAEPAAADPAASKKAAIAAALERARAQRARAQRAAVQPKNVAELSPTQQAEIADIEARRAEAGLPPAAPTPSAPTQTES